MNDLHFEALGIQRKAAPRGSLLKDDPGSVNDFDADAVSRYHGDPI
ncbi:hypothetical protein [Mesorhizobium hawassense]|nr:hypothetical protein [Mesorhizobium hawassense]